MDMNQYTPLSPSPDAPSPAELRALGIDDEEVLPPHAEPDGDENMVVVENEDGSVTVRYLEEEEAERENARFDDNLVDMDLPGVADLEVDLKRLIEQDFEDRKGRDKQYRDGLEKTGLANDTKGGADFDGASAVTHPMLAKGSVDFGSRAIKELFPANGPCKTQIIGKADEAKLDKAERKKRFMNWQFTTGMPETRPGTERLLSQIPLAGNAYRRWWWDAQLKRPCNEVIYSDQVALNNDASDFYTARRATIAEDIDSQEFQRRVDSGLYSEDAAARAGNAPGMSDNTDAAEAAAKIEGVNIDPAYNDDGLRRVFMCFATLSVEGDKEAPEGAYVPYIVHVDSYSGKVLGLYRNWDYEDATFKRKDWVSDWGFLPWRGPYAIGLYHLIGSLSTAATGALRAILDAAHAANMPGGLKLKGGRNAGQTVAVNPMELAELDAPPGVDDIRKLVMSFPFDGPSPVLYNVLEWLTQQAEVVVATASEKIADGANDMPVGTALALIEGGSVNFSAIHARLHYALKKDLEIVHRLNAENLEDEYTVQELGELVVYRNDFRGPVDVVPVSDPNIFSETQRYAQLQAVMQLKADPVFAPFFKADRLLARALKLLQIEHEDFTQLPKEAERLSPAEENLAVSGDDAQPLKVYAEQDDMAHLQVHILYMTSPILGGGQLIGPRALAPLLTHCRDHILALYRKHTQAAVRVVAEIASAQGHPATPEQQQQAAAGFVDRMLAQLLEQTIMPGLQQAQAAVGQYAPKPQPSPDVAHAESTKLQLAQLEDKRLRDLKTQEINSNMQNDERDRLVTQHAAQIAQNAEAMKDSTQRWLAMFNAAQEQAAQQRSADLEMLKAEMASMAAAQMEVLKAALAQVPLQQEAGAGVDMTQMLQPLMDAMNSMAEDLNSKISGLDGKINDNHSIVQAKIAEATDNIKESQKQTTLLGSIGQLLKGGSKSGGNGTPPAQE